MSDPANLARRAAAVAEPAATRALDALMSNGLAWWDMMLRMQRSSLQSLSTYSPTTETRISGALPQRAPGMEVIPVGEERLNVATRVVQGETTRIRRRVIEQPVEQEVRLRDEKVIVERRPGPAGAAAPGLTASLLTETIVEMSDSTQVPTVWKTVHVGEEVVLRRQVTERTEKVRETLRRAVVDVEHERAEPAMMAAAMAEAMPARRAAEPDQLRRDTMAEAARPRPDTDAARQRAEADATRLRTEAEAARQRTEAEATRQRTEAEAEAAKARINAQGEAARERMDADAEAARQRTEAAAERKPGGPAPHGAPSTPRRS